MQIYCLKNENCSEQVISTLGTILNHAGFFFFWIDALSDAGDSGIILEYTPLNSSRPKTDNHHCIPMLTHPSQIIGKQENWQQLQLNSEEIPVIQKTVLQTAPDNYFGVDIIANAYYHLSRIEEGEFTHPDKIEPDGSFSILSEYGDFKLPVVDLLTDHFADWITQKAKANHIPLIRKSAFPKAQSFGLALTHDVDFVRAYHPVKKLFLKFKTLIGLSGNLSRAGIDKADKDQWGFDQLIPFYKQNGWLATFFFIAKYFEGRHLRYRIGSKKMKRLLHSLTEQNHEIGFHPSRFSFEHPKRYTKEKRKLEKITNVELSGMRHHYLRGLFPGLWKTAEQLKLKYEASLTHRRKSGFRSGTCRPYFSHESREFVLVIPTAFFENTLPEEGKNPDISLTEIKQLINTTKKHNGLLTTLWHTNNLNHPANYATIWQGFIKLIEQEKPFIARLDEHTRWISERNQTQIKSIKRDGTNVVFTITLPNTLTELTLMLPPEIDTISIKEETVEYNQTGSQLYIKNMNRHENITLTLDVPSILSG